MTRGYDTIATPPNHRGLGCTDALTPLGAVAAVTNTIKLGTAIVQIDTRTPAMLAMSAHRPRFDAAFGNTATAASPPSGSDRWATPSTTA